MSAVSQTANKPKYRILSLDGGGVRCIVQLAILREMEKAMGPLHQQFDMIIGSSVGALLGCGISNGFGIEESTAMFYDFADEVFSKNCRWHEKLRRRMWWSYTKHNDEKTIAILKAIYGDTRMQDLKVKSTMVLCYNPLKSRPEIITSDDPKYAQVPVWQACKATTAAPLYFKPGNVELGRTTVTLLDGGLISNNPALFAYVKALNHLRQENPQANHDNLVLVSLGSGKISDTPKTCVKGHLNSLTTAPFFGGSEATHFGMRDLLGQAYYRFQVEIPNALKSPDESHNLNELHSIANEVIEKHYRGTIKELALNLKQSRTDDKPRISSPKPEPVVNVNENHERLDLIPS